MTLQFLKKVSIGWAVLGLLILALAGCQGGATAPSAVTTAVSEPVAATEPAELATETAVPAAASSATAALAPTVSANVEPATELAPTPTLPLPANLEITPSQTEGPYYPITAPPDRDSDLTTVPGSDQTAAGQILWLNGRVLSQNGAPVAGAVVEIWQTDDQGIYMHPGDAGTANRDPNFQFFGEAVAGADGSYAFKTIVPGLYEPRPRHIHFKVKVGGQTVLTSQFYFAGLDGLSGGEFPEPLVLTAVPGTDEAGKAILTAQKDIVLSG